MMQRLTFLNACTFSFATHANPLTQHMYECTTCNQSVCVVCMVRHRRGITCVRNEFVLCLVLELNVLLFVLVMLIACYDYLYWLVFMSA